MKAADWQKLVEAHRIERAKENRAVGDVVEFLGLGGVEIRGVIVEKDYMPRSWFIATADGEKSAVSEYRILRKIESADL